MYLKYTKETHIEYLTIQRFFEYKDQKIIVFNLANQHCPYTPHPGELIEIFTEGGDLLVQMKGKTFQDLTPKERYVKYEKETQNSPLYRKGGELRTTKAYLRWALEQETPHE